MMKALHGVARQVVLFAAMLFAVRAYPEGPDLGPWVYAGLSLTLFVAINLAYTLIQRISVATANRLLE